MIQNKKNYIIKLFTAIYILITVSLLCTPTYALTDHGVRFSVQNIIEGELPPVPETFTFTLTALDGAPMPNGSGNTIQISGAATGSFGEIIYTQVGDYRYEIRQSPADSPWYTYDEGVFVAIVQVTWVSPVNDEMQCSVYVEKKNEHRKVDQISFTNFFDLSTYNSNHNYPVPPDEDTPDTGDPTNPILWIILCGCSAMGLAVSISLINLRTKEKLPSGNNTSGNI